jgi:hypothetical protein
VGDDIRSFLSEKGSELFKQIATITADTILLSGWTLAEYSFEQKIVPHFPLSTEVLKQTFFAARILFAASTLIPIVIYITRDIWVLVLKARMQILTNKSKLEGMRTRLPANDSHASIEAQSETAGITAYPATGTEGTTK